MARPWAEPLRPRTRPAVMVFLAGRPGRHDTRPWAMAIPAWYEPVGTRKEDETPRDPVLKVSKHSSKYRLSAFVIFMT